MKTILFIILFAVDLLAQGVTIEWDPVTTLENGLPASEMIGYRVFYGTESKSYPDSTGSLLARSAALTLAPHDEYFFAVKAYNSKGGSKFSDEVSKYVYVTQTPSKATVSLSGGSKALAVGNLSRYSFFELHLGDEYYSDRAYVLEELPDFLDSALAIKTSNGNEDKQSVDPNWIEFDVNMNVDVFVFYNRTLTPPDWLGEDTGIRVSTTDAGVGYFMVYKNSFKAGRISLGGNESPGTQSMYFAAILPQR